MRRGARSRATRRQEAATAKFRLSTGQIARAVHIAPHGGSARRPRRADRAPSSRRRPAGLELRAQRARHSVAPGRGWDELVLPERQLAVLRSISSYLRHRDRVLGDWGFERRSRAARASASCSRARAGRARRWRPGCRRRARAASSSRVDLATVVSKYVGETEQNLERSSRPPRGPTRSSSSTRPTLSSAGAPKVSDSARPLREPRGRLPPAAPGGVRRRGHPGHQPQAERRRRLHAPPRLRRRVPASPTPPTAGASGTWSSPTRAGRPATSTSPSSATASSSRRLDPQLLAGGDVRSGVVVPVAAMAHFVRAIAAEYGKLGRLTVEAGSSRTRDAARHRGKRHARARPRARARAGRGTRPDRITDRGAVSEHERLAKVREKRPAKVRETPRASGLSAAFRASRPDRSPSTTLQHLDRARRSRRARPGSHRGGGRSSARARTAAPAAAVARDRAGERHAADVPRRRHADNVRTLGRMRSSPAHVGCSLRRSGRECPGSSSSSARGAGAACPGRRSRYSASARRDPEEEIPGAATGASPRRSGRQASARKWPRPQGTGEQGYTSLRQEPDGASRLTSLTTRSPRSRATARSPTADPGLTHRDHGEDPDDQHDHQHLDELNPSSSVAHDARPSSRSAPPRGRWPTHTHPAGECLNDGRLLRAPHCRRSSADQARPPVLLLGAPRRASTCPK